ncbi:E3 ubiquitin-protein ligase ATL59, partial [Mucuna pruriens]
MALRVVRSSKSIAAVSAFFTVKIFCRRKIDSHSQPSDLEIPNIREGPPHAVGPTNTACHVWSLSGVSPLLACVEESVKRGTNLVTTVIGFGMSATFIVFVCTRIICGRLRGGVESRMMYEIESRIDIEQPEHHVNDPESEPVLLDAIPTLKFNQEAFSSTEHTQCVICLADYKEREVLRIMPKCGHTFHLSCIDIWLRKQSTCPVCRLPLKNSSETKHVRPVTFTMSQTLDESHTSERNEEDTERHDEPIGASNSLQPTSGEQEARQ